MPPESLYRRSRVFSAAAVAIAFALVGSANVFAQTVPSPWRSSDIGNPPSTGSATLSGGQFTIQASGADIWGTSDQFHFVYQPVTGDVDVVARVDSVTAAHSWSKAGVMIRADLTPGSAHAYALSSARKGTAFQRRRSTGASSYHTAGPLTAPPMWTRVIRQGNVVTAYTSSDGSRWTRVSSDTIALGATAYVGLAVTSHASALTTARLSNVTVSPLGLPQPWQNGDVGAPSPAGSVVHSNGTFTVRGSGYDIWDSADQFQFVYQQVSGDVDIRARVASVEYVHHWTKGGIMIRDSLAAGARHASLFATPGSDWSFQRRMSTNGWSDYAEAGAGTAPGWVRLVRTGSQIDAYRSSDGVNWRLTGTQSIGFGQTIYVGLAVTSHASGQLAQAVFDNVRVEAGASTNEPPTVALSAPSSGATFTAPATITVSATASDPEGPLARVDFYANGTLLGSDTSSPYSISWGSVAAGSYSITAVARDSAGAATTSAARAITVNAPTNQPPTVSLSAPASGATFTAPASVTVSATASDPEGALSRVDFYANGTLIGSDSSSPYSIGWSNVPAGSYSLTAVARDAAGASTTSAARSISVTATATAPRLVEFTASVDHPTVTRYVLEIFAAGANPATATPVATSDLGRPTPNASSVISVDRSTFFSGLAAGSYIATVRAENSSGFNRSPAVSFTR